MCDILVLDDDPLVRATLVEALSENGLKVVGAAAEVEALVTLRLATPPRVFVTDLDLGTKRNGFVVGAIARMLFPDVPIIYITGRPEAAYGHVMDARERLMQKPFRPSELMATAQHLMGEARVAA